MRPFGKLRLSQGLTILVEGSSGPGRADHSGTVVWAGDGEATRPCLLLPITRDWLATGVCVCVCDRVMLHRGRVAPPWMVCTDTQTQFFLNVVAMRALVLLSHGLERTAMSVRLPLP